jgi:hypothetical protein
MLPLGCLPRWGREGVTFTASKKCKKNRGSYRISPEHITTECRRIILLKAIFL